MWQQAFTFFPDEQVPKEDGAFTIASQSRKHGNHVSISPTFYEQLVRKCSIRIFYVLTVWVCNFLAEGKYRKSCLYNIGQIDPMRAIVVKKDTLDGEVILATFF